VVTGFAEEKLEVICNVSLEGGHLLSTLCLELVLTRHPYLPAMSTLRMACGIENPSYTGTACVTPSPESRTRPVVRPDEYLFRDVIIRIESARRHSGDPGHNAGVRTNSVPPVRS
jgi:hypothetical protein